MTDELVAKWSTKPADEHLPLREYMFAFAIKTMLQASFGKYFKDEQEVLKIKKSSDIVSGHFFFFYGFRVFFKGPVSVVQPFLTIIKFEAKI